MNQNQTSFQTVVLEGYAAERGLSKLGLTMDGLVEVVLRGESARAGATAHDPLPAAGWDAYRHRVRALRDINCPAGWTVLHDAGLEMILSPDKKRVVVTRAGEDGVGLTGTQPQPKQAVGASTARSVGANLVLDPSWFNKAPSAELKGKPEVWMLLVERTGDVVCAELSRPSGTEEDGTVSGWLVRILLPNIDLNAPQKKRPVPEASPPTEIDVPVRRKR